MSEQTTKTGPLPLVLGVSGHRDLRPEDRAGLEERVRAILGEFRERYPHTPLVLLSALAEGADRLVARVALQQGVRLVVPLPMPVEEYARDFDTAESRAEFDELLGKAEASYVLPFVPGVTVESVCGQAEHRAHQYALVGAHIVRQSQVLIALWNGLHVPSEGGTGQVVQFQREGIPEPYASVLASGGEGRRGYLEPADTGPVEQIVTPRANHPGLEGTPLTAHTLAPLSEEGEHNEGRRAESFDRVYGLIDAFNADALRLAADPALEAARKTNAGYLLADPLTSGLSPATQALRVRYSVADTLAQSFQRRALEILRVLCAFALIAVLTFEITAKLAPHSGPLAMLFPILLGLTYAVWFGTVKRGKWQDRYQDYRALAEGLRVQFFWRLSGLSTSVADHYLRKQRGELDWIRIAIQNLSFAALPPSDWRESPCRVDLVQEHWVQNQRRYFSRAAHRSDEELERYEAWVKRLLMASPAVALLTALAMLIPSPLQHLMHDHEIIHKWLVILTVALAGLAGVIHTYIDKRALSQHAKQFERMATLFAIAETHLEDRLTPECEPEAQQLIQELGREALAENGDWVLTHRERPIDVPHAG